MKMLFITSRNAYSTSGELRLIKNRAESLADIYGVVTDFEVVRFAPHLKRKQEPIKCGLFHVYGHYVLNRPLVMRKIYRDIKELSKTTAYDAVVFSSGSVFSLLDKVKRLFPDAKFIADIHGASEELIEFPASSVIRNCIQKAFYRRSKRIDARYLPKFEGFFAVSDALIEYLKKEYALDDKHFFKIPCSISDSSVDVDSIKTNRERYRKKYGLKEKDLLFIYSGGTSPWQCIDKSVRLFGEIKKNNPECADAKMLIMTGNIDKVRQYEAQDIIIDSYPGNEVRNVLCAGDYAFLLRDDYVTNNVAYPNKFLEYVSCGLKIIATPYVHDVADQIRKFNLGVIYDYSSPLNIDVAKDRADYMGDIDRRNELFRSVSFKSTLKPFIDYIGE